METRILVIEDDPSSLELMGYLLQAFGYTAITVGSGEAGLESARRGPPDLILCDIQLPGIDGHQVARQLKDHPTLAKVPVLAVTALAMVGDRDKVMASGFDGYLSKPIVPETFVRQIEAFLPAQQRSLPQVVCHEESPPPPPAFAANLGTILIVDDLQANLRVLASVLEPSGYTVITSDNIKESFQLANQHVLDLIVSDLHLHNESGFDLLRLIKADPDLCAIPFIFISSTGWSERNRAVAFKLGAERFLFRPIEAPVVVATVEAVISKHRKGRATDASSIRGSLATPGMIPSSLE